MTDEQYPSEEQSETIKKWEIKSINDCVQLLEAIKPIWHFADCGYWRQTGDKFELSTGGWSGNEEIISALQENVMFWLLFWQSSRRGGHYVFCSV